MNWDADRLADYLPRRAKGQNTGEEERIDHRFPPDPDNAGRLLVDPAVIVDAHDRILAWYLPHALSLKRQVGVQMCAMIPGLMVAGHHLGRHP